jgi:hypothetical protein
MAGGFIWMPEMSNAYQLNLELQTPKRGKPGRNNRSRESCTGARSSEMADNLAASGLGI